MPIRIGGTAAGNASAPAMGAVPTSGWTAVNMQSGAAFSADLDGMLFTIPAVGSSQNWQYQYRAYPAAPFELTVYLDVMAAAIADVAWSACGIVIANNSSALITVGPQYGTSGVGSSGAGWNVWGAQYSGLTSFSGSDDGAWPINRFGGVPKWYRLTDDNTNIVLKCSMNGIDWQTIGSSLRTSFLTPTRIGLGGTNHNTGSNILMRCRSWHGVA